MAIRLAAIFVAVFLATLTSAAGSTINVPADYPTIQQAIIAAVDGDTVLVSPGTYVENIDFIGKDIVVTSSGGAAVTTIDGQNLKSAVAMLSGEPQSAIIAGVLITNGNGHSGAGDRRLYLHACNAAFRQLDARRRCDPGLPTGPR